MEHFYHNIHGWFCFSNLYIEVVKNLPDNAHIVEVGAWKGRSTAFMAVEIINSGKNVKFDVVDIWTGVEDYLTSDAFTDDKEYMQYNKDIFELFKKNVQPILHTINPIKMPSIEAAKLYEYKSLDFVLIDADHSYENVKKDILAWLPKMKIGSVIAGDDYNAVSFPGVIQAVHEVFTTDQISFSDSCWVVKL